MAEDCLREEELAVNPRTSERPSYWLIVEETSFHDPMFRTVIKILNVLLGKLGELK